MKRLFIVTYWVSFESGLKSKHDIFENFWFWRAPPYLVWLRRERAEKEKERQTALVVVNCGVL